MKKNNEQKEVTLDEIKELHKVDMCKYESELKSAKLMELFGSYTSEEVFENLKQEMAVKSWALKIKGLLVNAHLTTDPYGSEFLKIGETYTNNGTTYIPLQYRGTIYDGSGDESHSFLVHIIKSTNEKVLEGIKKSIAEKKPVLVEIGWGAGGLVNLEYAKRYKREAGM